MTGVSIPLGSFKVAGRSYSYYRLLLVAVALILILITYLVFKYTKFGLHSRATMQNRDIANSLGVNANKMNAGTFMLGSPLAGLCGGLYLPTMSLTPSYGESFGTELCNCPGRWCRSAAGNRTCRRWSWDRTEYSEYEI